MILAIDTATRWTGLALHNGTAVIAETGWHAINTQTIELSPAIAAMWQRAGVTPDQLKGIAIAIGPGSYTGLRVGLGVAKGLALAHGTPLVGIPTLHIVAAAIGQQNGRLCVIAEAGRTRVCAALYQWHAKKGWQPRTKPDIFAWDDLLEQIEGPTTFVGEITPQATTKIRSSNKPFTTLPIAASVRRAGYLAELGWQRLRRHQADDSKRLTPLYLRNPDGSKT